MSLLVVGSVAFDAVKTPFGARERVLGGSATYFSSAASYFAPVQLVAVVGKDFPQDNIDYLRGRGVDTEGLSVDKTGETFFWSGEYNFDLNNCKTLETRLNVFESFNPQLPEQYQHAEYVFLANIDPVLQRQVLDQVKKPKLIAMDTMNFWISSKREELLKTIARVDMLIINDGEARQLAEEPNLVRAAKKITGWGPKYLIVKQGEYGALLFSRTDVFRAPAYPLESLFDPTGAGDSFAGGLMGFLAQNGAGESQLKQAVIAGSVLASFCVEDFSVDRFRSLSTNEISERYKAFHRLAHFDDVLPLPTGPMSNGGSGNGK